jgi:hypothetical protein
MYMFGGDLTDDEHHLDHTPKQEASLRVEAHIHLQDYNLVSEI